MDVTEFDKLCRDVIVAQSKLRVFLGKQGGFAAVCIMLANCSKILEEMLHKVRVENVVERKQSEVGEVSAILGIHTDEIPANNVTPITKHRNKQ